MRIIGGKDYYDNALSYGHDPLNTFVRGKAVLYLDDADKLGIKLPSLKEVSWKLKEGKVNRTYNRRWWDSSFDGGEITVKGETFKFSLIAVIACGKRYQGIKIVHSVRPVFSTVETTHFFWDLDALNQFLENTPLTVSHVEKELTEYFTHTELTGSVRQAIMDNRWTVLIYDGRILEKKKEINSALINDRRFYDRLTRGWLINQDQLKSVEFYRVIPANIMFQEIDMWIGGVLGSPGKEMVNISDEIRAAKHGMDKTSFRRPKQEK